MDPLSRFSALRAFETAARRGSFQQAADEMGLTPSAISYQIRNLEEFLGQPLFLRQHRKVSLTPAGETLHAYVRRGFAELRNGLAAVQSVRHPHLLRVTAAPAFANAFLTHHLPAFERDAEIEVQLIVGHAILDLAADSIDVAIRFSDTPPPDLWSERLADLAYTPVCVPEIAAGLRVTEDLAHATRINVRENASGWANWFSELGVTGHLGRELHVETMNVALQMALDGSGISLIPRVLVGRHLSEGRLVAPYPHDLVSRNHYWLACRRGDEISPKVVRFSRWLHSEVQAFATTGELSS